MLTVKHVGDFLCQEDDNGNVEIGLQVNGHRRLHSDVNSLLPLDLMEGYKGEYLEQLNYPTIQVLLKWLIVRSPEGDLDKLLDGAQFVCRRGVLARMAAGKHIVGPKGDWALIAERKKGIIYLEERKSDYKGKEWRNSDGTISEVQNRGMHMGYRFERYLAKPCEVLHSSEENQGHTDFRIAVIADIKSLQKHKKSFRLLYTGEIDAIDEEGRHVELKTAKQKYSLNNNWFLKEISPKWWLQSILVGVDYILVGLKDDQGIVNEIEKLELDSLKNSEWNGPRLINDLHYVLQQIYSEVLEGESWYFKGKSGFLQAEKDAERIVSHEFIQHFNL